MAGKVREVAKQRDQVCMSLEGFVRRPFQEQTIVSYYNCTNKDPTTSPPFLFQSEFWEPKTIVAVEPRDFLNMYIDCVSRHISAACLRHVDGINQHISGRPEGRLICLNNFMTFCWSRQPAVSVVNPMAKVAPSSCYTKVHRMTGCADVFTLCRRKWRCWALKWIK